MPPNKLTHELLEETQEEVDMALTRKFKKTVLARVERDPEFAQALLDEAATLFLNDEPETARVTLRDLVNATLGSERLAKLTDTSSKSLHRMLSPNGNPSMDNLAAIFGAVSARGRSCFSGVGEAMAASGFRLPHADSSAVHSKRI